MLYRRACFALLSALLIGTSLGACAVDDRAQDRQSDHLRQMGVRNVGTDNYRWTDGDNNFSYQNPNIRVGEPRPRTINADARRIELATEKVKGVEKATVRIAGGTALITIDAEDDLTRSQVADVEDEVIRQIGALMPRYRIRVTPGVGKVNRLRESGDPLRGNNRRD